MARESMEFDVLIVGGGPAGLAAACRLRQLCAEHGHELAVALVEKGSEIGAHILSGAVFEPKPLNELFPDWKERGAPLNTPVKADVFHWMTSDTGAIKVPNWMVPKPMHNEGNFVVSLGRLCQWLGEQAENLGCDIFPGFAATELLIEDGKVVGVVTGDLGVGEDGEQKPTYQEGYELRGRYVIFAEGCRGSLGKQLEAKFNLRNGQDPQHYGIGLKEVWTISPEKHQPGLVVHSLGWPLDGRTDGGGFLYHADNNEVYLGLVVSLGYQNPHLSPFEEFQRWKQHPRIRETLEGGKRVSYGARALNKGGYFSLPKLTVPGGLMVGCEAGFLNAAKIKGSHTAMKTGMLAAETVFEALKGGDVGGADLTQFEQVIQQSWVHEELYQARNFSPGLKRFGVTLGGTLAYLEHNILRGKSPLNIRNPVPDHETLIPADQAKPIEYPKPDGTISFDRLSSVFLSSTNHEEDQPCHLRLEDADIPIRDNLPKFAEPAQRYCPAGVYEIVEADGSERFQINAQNCVHCKTCDIKDPAQNITWVPPEGGGGPNYSGM